MSGQYKEIAFNIGVVAQIVAIVVVPVVASLLIVELVRRLRRLRQYEQAARGLCVGCGYDLSGNVSGVCPECGRAR